MNDELITTAVIAIMLIVVFVGVTHDVLWLIKNVGVAVIVLAGVALGILMFGGLVMVGG